MLILSVFFAFAIFFASFFKYFARSIIGFLPVFDFQCASSIFFIELFTLSFLICPYSIRIFDILQ